MAQDNKSQNFGSDKSNIGGNQSSGGQRSSDSVMPGPKTSESGLGTGTGNQKNQSSDSNIGSGSQNQ